MWWINDSWIFESVTQANSASHTVILRGIVLPSSSLTPALWKPTFVCHCVPMTLWPIKSLVRLDFWISCGKLFDRCFVNWTHVKYLAETLKKQCWCLLWDTLTWINSVVYWNDSGFKKKVAPILLAWLMNSGRRPQLLYMRAGWELSTGYCLLCEMLQATTEIQKRLRNWAQRGS